MERFALETFCPSFATARPSVGVVHDAIGRAYFQSTSRGVSNVEKSQFDRLFPSLQTVKRAGWVPSMDCDAKVVRAGRVPYADCDAMVVRADISRRRRPVAVPVSGYAAVVASMFAMDAMIPILNGGV